MKLKQIIEYLENICPTGLAEIDDVVGLQVGHKNQKINKILIALDCSKQVIQKAMKEKCDLIITHHPLLWGGKQEAKKMDSIKIKLKQLSTNKISIYSLHTNYDKKFLKYEILQKIPVKIINDSKESMIIFGQWEKAINFSDVLKIIKKAFAINWCKYWKSKEKKKIQTIAVVPGAGGFALESLIKNKIDLFVTGELKWSQWIKCKDLEQNVITIGHQTEETFVVNLTNKLQKILKNKVKLITHFESPIHIFY